MTKLQPINTNGSSIFPSTGWTSPLVPHSTFDKIFENFFKDIDLWSGEPGHPQYEQYVNDNGDLVIQFALAGYSKENLKVEANGSSMVVSATKNEDGETRKFARRSFTKTFKDPTGSWQFSKAVPNYKDGMLTITIPSKEVVKMKELKIS